MTTPRKPGQRAPFDDSRMPWPGWYFQTQWPTPGSSLGGIGLQAMPADALPQRRRKTPAGAPRKGGVWNNELA